MKQIWVTEAAFRRLERVRQMLDFRDLTDVVDYAAVAFEHQANKGAVNRRGNVVKMKGRKRIRWGMDECNEGLVATILHIPLDRPFVGRELVALGFPPKSVKTVLSMMKRDGYLRVLVPAKSGRGGRPAILIRKSQPPHKTKNRPTENHETHGGAATSRAVTENPDALADGDAGTPE